MRKTIPVLALLLVLGLALVHSGCGGGDDDPVIPPPACAITVTTPVAGRSWYTGSQININWKKTSGDSVMIELFKGADRAGIISAGAPNTGFYPWLKATTFGQASGEDYSVQVSNLADSGCSDRSGLFELIDVSNCFIKFPWSMKDSIPDQIAGRDFLISWNSEHTSGLLDLELWYEPFAQLGDLVGVIARDLPDTGSYTWNVDSFNRGTSYGYRFKIKDVDSPGCGDTSIHFRIIDDVNCSISVLGINENQEYVQGSDLDLFFLFENSSGVVDLKLYSGNEPVTGGSIVEDYDTQNGTVSYNWMVTDFGYTGPAFDRFNIRAWDATDGYCVGVSSNFAISQ